MGLLGGLFGHRSPSQPDSLFGGVMAGAQRDPALAELAASTGNFSGPSQSRAVVPYRPQSPDLPMGGPQGAPAAPPGASPSGPPAAPPADDLHRRLSYAQELGIPIEGKHKFNFGRALLAFVGGAPVAQALLRGDYERAATLNQQGQLIASRSRQAHADLAHQLSVYSALRDSGVPKNEAIVAMTNLDELGKNWNTRYRTEDVAPGHILRRPNLDGSVSSFTAPNLVQHGADYQYVTPPGAANPVDGLPTPGGPPSIPMLPAAPDQTATLGRSGRQISLPGADDGEADALVRQGINAGASVDQITGALKNRFGYSDDVLGRVTQALGPALQWKAQNPDKPYMAEVSLGMPDAAPSRPSLPAPPRGAPTFNAPRANVVAAGSLRTDAEQYADSLGLARGSREWLGAVQDAELKAHGPTAYGQATTLQNARLDVQMRGQDITQGNNVRTNTTVRRGQDITDARGRYIHDHPTPKAPTQGSVIGAILAKRASGQALTPSEQATLTDYYLGRGGRPQQEKAKSKAPEGTVLHAADGHTIVKRGGQWVDAQTGRPAS